MQMDSCLWNVLYITQIEILCLQLAHRVFETVPSPLWLHTQVLCLDISSPVYLRVNAVN